MKVLTLFFYVQSLWAVSPFFQRFQTAQDQFKNGNSVAAQNSFTLLVKSYDLKPVSNIQKESLHYSMLRLAQLAKTEEDQEKWLKKAYLTSPHLYPDREVFPPPLVDSFYTVANRVQARKVATQTRYKKAKGLEAQRVIKGKNLLDSFYPQQPVENRGLEDQVPQLTQQGPIKKWYKNEWVWIGAAIISAGVVLSQSNQKRKTTPTSRDKF